ncbi:MAG: DUF3180 domain-containing protein [Actinomycetes bacterium]
MLRRTSIVWLIVLAMVGLGAGWTLVLTVDAVAGRILGVPLMASIALWVLALGIVMWAVLSRSRLPGAAQSGSDSIRIRTDDATAAAHQAANRMPPIIAARTAALAMAASRTGALIGGFYLGISLALLGSVATPTGADSFTAALVAMGAAVSMTIAGVWLESLCRIRDDQR